MSREQRQPRPRIESLTDLIFGLALSIGAVGLLNYRPTTAQDIVFSVGFFFFGFLILISIWLRYTEIMSVLPAETGGTRTLNVFLLFLVAIEPYLFNLIGSAGVPEDAATTAYALDIGAIYAILAGFNSMLSSKRRHLVEASLHRKYRTIRNLQVIVVAFFWISILPEFYTTTTTVLGLTIPVRFVIWMLTFFTSRTTWILKRLGRL
jgi:uncharacterized membrane protein